VKHKLLVLGRTQAEYVQLGEEVFMKKLKHYVDFSYLAIPEPKQVQNMPILQRKNIEGKSLLAEVQAQDFLCLLDVQGKMMSSEELAKYIENKQNQALRTHVWAIGGAYGFSEEVYQRAQAKLSFSKMTFPHDLSRLLLLEQLYRAYSILHAQPYHHG
jgi:23S rRNA (pseudouridine1915-N3)-methyltransferase